MIKLKSLEVIDNSERNSSVDVFRSLAIISVVLFHFNRLLPLGYIGVDLFFVISGLLVGGILVKQFKENEPISFFRFILQRGFKIWPSYYTYILITALISVYFFGKVFHFSDLSKYIFFYENYTGTCTIVWSLCVEEHFYILLPILFLVVINFIPVKHKLKSLFVFLFLIIVSGILFKWVSYTFTRSQDTFSATHNRIDALAWGVLLSLLLSYFNEKLRSETIAVLSVGSGIIILIVALVVESSNKWILFDKLFFHSIIPFAFFLLLLGTYFIDFKKLLVLRFISYYSYNWYLWHSLVGGLLLSYGLVVYLISTFAIAVIATVLIEEPMLKNRSRFLGWLYAKPPKLRNTAIPQN